MHKVSIIFLIVLLILGFTSSFCLAKETLAPADEYYSNLAEIIEAHQDKPKKCIAKVKSFIKRNKKLIAKVKEARNLTLEQEKAPKQARSINMPGSEAKKPGLSGQAKFNRAMAKFSQKYPKQAQIIATLNLRAILIDKE